ncbi:FAD dependent oxidoreductase [Aspergillus ambiguus]|uniref:NAD(P)/FAD-dependent oxidoreductase n=1 Tax=Aspergillus ambiguus TaxID=176160 RepID=UPI003CCD7616
MTRHMVLSFKHQPNKFNMESQYDVVIIGAGIVGSAIAYHLASTAGEKKIALIDRSISTLRGSTEIAPGFVGQYNESGVLTNLAVESVKEYTRIPGGFEVVGGLEVATAREGVDRLRSRWESATKAGLAAELLCSDQAVSLAPELIKDDVQLALYFPGDGAADARRITSFYQGEARATGVQLIEADVIEVQQANGRVNGVITTAGSVQANTVVVATGIWAPQLCKLDFPIPVVPVAHPYMYGAPHEPKLRRAPWVRWPEHVVYARDHGTHYGLGSYDHRPIPEEAKLSAVGNWIPEFDETLNEALRLIPEQTSLAPQQKFNGIFSMTPDNMPLAGSVPSVDGLFVAAAVWVTHAAGVARFITQMLNGKPVDHSIKTVLDPARFRGQDASALTQKSLDGYNHIYKTQENGA